MDQMVKNLLAMWETWVQYLGGEELLGEGMATHFSILTWETEELDSYSPQGHKESDMSEKLEHTVLHRRPLRLLTG